MRIDINRCVVRFVEINYSWLISSRVRNAVVSFSVSCCLLLRIYAHDARLGALGIDLGRDASYATGRSLPSRLAHE